MTLLHCCAPRRAFPRRRLPAKPVLLARHWPRPMPGVSSWRTISMDTFQRSKLPDVGTTIFTVMSRRARELGALNLGQGFPDYEIDPRLTELTAVAMTEGRNQYAPMEGVIELRQQIAQKLDASYGITVDPDSEITVTL